MYEIRTVRNLYRDRKKRLMKQKSLETDTKKTFQISGEWMGFSINSGLTIN